MMSPRQQHNNGQRNNNNGNNNNQQRQPRRFDPVPMTYAALLQKLLAQNLVALRHMPANNGRQPANYDANARCDFHSGGVGHNIENCYAFKCKVHDLLDSQQINFIPNPNAPNVVN